MNWMILDAIALAVLILFFVIGRHRGLIAMALLLVGTLTAFWAAHQFAQPAAQWAYDNFAHQWLVEYVDEKLEDAQADNDIGALAGVLKELSDQVDLMSDFDVLKDKADLLLNNFDWFISSQSGQEDVLSFPEGIDPDPEQQGMIVQLLEEGHSLSEALVQTVLKPLALNLLELIAFLLIFIVLSILIKLLIHLSQILNKLPLVGGMNRFLGGLCGLAEGLVCIYVIGILLRTVASAAGSDAFITTELLKETKLLSAIIYFLE
ncbi:MAG: CvpA family protein [Oscillospiraceae bacterium]|nr:CvpA family protein [Oscillospiraceae bacterium]